MKKFISVLSALILSAAAMPMCATAEGDTGLPPKEDSTEAVIVPDYVSGTYENLNYRQYSDHVVVEGRYDVKGDIVIPSEVNGLPVTELGSFELSKITSVVIPDSVTSIGDNAFLGCTALSVVYFHGTSNNYDDIELSTTGNTNFTNVAIFTDDNFTLNSGVYTLSSDGYTKSINSYSRITGNVYIPASVKSIEGNTVEKFIVDKSNPNYFSDENGVLFDKNVETLVAYPAGRNTKDYSVPSSVKLITTTLSVVPLN